MPANQVYNPNKSRVLDKPVAAVAVAVGSVTITTHDEEESFVVKAGETKTFPEPLAGATISSKGGARCNVVYDEDIPAGGDLGEGVKAALRTLVAEDVASPGAHQEQAKRASRSRSSKSRTSKTSKSKTSKSTSRSSSSKSKSTGRKKS